MFSWLRSNATRLAHTKSFSRHPSNMVALKSLASANWTPRRYDQLSIEGYQKNVLVYRCINLIARNAASVPILLYEKDSHGNQHEVDHHPILDLLKKPNARQSYSAFIETLLSHLLLSGNSYIEAYEHDDLLTPHQIYALRPDRMEIIPGTSVLPKAFIYRVDQHKRIIPINEEKASPVLHLKLFHPLNDWYGMSPLEAAARAVDEHNAVSNHNLALLQNGGRPTGALIFKGEEELTDQQREELRQSIQKIYQGDSNAGRIAVMEGDFEWKEMGLSPRDLDFIEGKCLSGREIAQAFGIPPMLIGIPGDATFANYKEARLHLWEDTILPTLNFVLKELTQWLCHGVYGNYYISYNSDSIAALAPKREALWQKINSANFLTLNEKREALGYGPLKREELSELESNHAQ